MKSGFFFSVAVIGIDTRLDDEWTEAATSNWYIVVIQYKNAVTKQIKETPWGTAFTRQIHFEEIYAVGRVL